jgi:hypothetical protein
MNTSQLIAYINAINVGEMDGIRAKLTNAKQACRELDYVDLAEMLTEAEDALGRADLKTYRKRVETVVARLGHLR